MRFSKLQNSSLAFSNFPIDLFSPAKLSADCSFQVNKKLPEDIFS